MGSPHSIKNLKLFTSSLGKNFVIVGFPSNNFMWQEPGSNNEIKEFCKKNYGVSFPIMSKINVKGRNKHLCMIF